MLFSSDQREKTSAGDASLKCEHVAVMKMQFLHGKQQHTKIVLWTLTIVFWIVKGLQNKVVISRSQVMSPFKETFKRNTINTLCQAFNDVVAILAFLQRLLSFPFFCYLRLLSGWWTGRERTRKHHLKDTRRTKRKTVYLTYANI